MIPYLDGAIRYWKEKGLWKPEHQAHNDKLVERQKVLADAWMAVQAANHSDEKVFEQSWMSTRAAALKKAGFEAVVTTW